MNYDTFFYIFKNFEKYTLNPKFPLKQNKTMSKTTLSPIIAGTMNWEFGKPNQKKWKA
jgi:hypothetical protein